MKKILSIILSLLLLLSVIQPSMIIAFADDEPADELVSTEVQMNGEDPVEEPPVELKDDTIYYVTFHFMDDVTEPAVYEVYSGQCLFRINSPTREGYVFDDWYYENGEPFNFRTPITEDIELYAGWLKNLVVTFDLNYEESENISIDIGYGTKISAPNKPVREGYTFIDWYTTADYTQGKAFNFNTQITKDTILYARWEKNPVVTFDFNYEGLESLQVEVNYNGLVETPSYSIREGFTLVGWYTTADYTQGSVFDFNTQVTKDTTLYARWEKNPVVTFNFNYKGLESLQVEVNYNGLVEAPSNSSREEYSITAWFDNPECKGTKFNFDTPIAENITLYAKWEDRLDEYNYIDESGNNSKIEILYKNRLKSDFAFNNSSLQSGWYVVTSSNVNIDNRITISGDVKILLTDGSSITFANGIKLLKGNTLTIYSESLEEGVMGSLTALGKGNNAAIGTNGDNDAGTFSMCGGKVTASAEEGSGIGGGLGYSGGSWANNGPNAGIVNIYNGILYATSNGSGTGIGGGPAGVHDDAFSAPANGGNGGELNAYGGSIYAKSAKYQAIGGGHAGFRKVSGRYADGQNGSPVVVNFYGNMGSIGEINQDAEVEIYEVVHVAYHYMDEEIDDKVINVRVGEIPKKPDVISKNGKSTSDWYFDKSLQRVYNFTSGLTSNTDLYTKWMDDVVVSFDYQDGTTGIKTETIHYNTTVTKPNDPVREGYSFMGWYNIPNYKQGKKFDFSSKILTSQTIYAAWEKDLNITINYNYEGSTNQVVVIKYNNKLAKPADPVRDGYTFMGWYDAANYKAANVFNFDSQLVEDTTVYAGWEKNPIVTFDYGDKFDSEKITIAYGGLLSIPKSKMKDGMCVAGWYLDSNYSELFDDKQPILIDTTLYSKWESAIKYYDENGQEQAIDSPCVTIDSGHGFEKTIIESGWYFIKGNVTVGSRAEIKGDVKFILENGAKVIFEQGIKLMSGNSLTIYPQSLNESEMGKLEAYGKDLCAAIGANGENTAGTFTMCGGIVTATADKGAGVGGGQGYAGADWANSGPNGGTVNIYNGVLTAKSNGYSAGIGGGRGGISVGGSRNLPVGGSGGTLNVYGGKVYASSRDGRAIGAGLGGGWAVEIGKPGADATVNLKTEATVKGAFNKDKVVEIVSGGSATGAILSNGNVFIPVAIAIVAIGVVAGLVIKKKKTN